MRGIGGRGDWEGFDGMTLADLEKMGLWIRGIAG